MMQNKPSVIVIATLAACFGTARAEHAGDVWVGRSAPGLSDNGRLKVSPSGFVPADNYAYLQPVSGALNGWGDNDPGFDRLTEAEPGADIYPLESGTEIWLELVSGDPAVRLIDSGFQIIDAPGESTLLGGANLHVHNTWHINSDDPAFDPQQCVWQMTFVLVDEGSTGYEDSEPFTFSFTNVPLEPRGGDFDGDEIVGSQDYAAMHECLSGPGELPAPDDPAVTTCEVECLNGFDFDEDRDVDLRDFAELQQAFTG